MKGLVRWRSQSRSPKPTWSCSGLAISSARCNPETHESPIGQPPSPLSSQCAAAAATSDGGGSDRSPSKPVR